MTLRRYGKFASFSFPVYVMMGTTFYDHDDDETSFGLHNVIVHFEGIMSLGTVVPVI